MNKEWRPTNWDKILWDTSKGSPEVKAYIEFGADTILQSLYEETKSNPIWLDKADDGHILICVKQ